ncbi:LysR substrate-binding domain-containing protein [Geodermatophilus poikilotrophus]|uniref:DNA-binding transcriptional regulator, LysR family n=1 Tax=Geodermatophilus poikilotrophus TaxID=1333667 RepID=A0A1H9YW30_9ACTN|nr:LysR substrate-binding domain-containing protein [Geodermatophilus poikilotrophus]SES73343.1 DNA-binding transcriptional regulator, LysR family [Geodermatophilus poikilotrophus]
MSRRPDVTLTQLRYFVQAATHGGMTHAANELRVAQSAVSAAVAQLERQVGTQLFIRQRARGLVLTAAGEELLSDARAVLAHVDEVLDSARGRGEDLRGTIRVACFVTLAPFVVPELLADLAEHHPGIEVEILETEAESLGTALRTGAVELALSYDLGLGPEIERQVVAEVEPYVILPPEHRLAGRRRVHLEQLAQEPMVLLDLPHSRDYFQRILSSAGVTPTVRYRSASYETVRGLVARGHGYSILNQRPVADVTYGGGTVVPCAIADELPPLSTVIARLSTVRPTARARAVATRARAVLQRATR